MPTKKKILATLDNSSNPPVTALIPVVENPAPVPPVPPAVAEEKDDDDAVPIQAVKPVKTDGRVKKPQTEAQKAATAKMKAALAAKWEKTRAEKIAMKEEHKKAVEERVVKKALSIKKKQIKEQLALDEISSDDEPMEEIVPKMKKAIARQAQPQAPPKQKIIFI